jgi:hypothetical protein
MVRRQSERAGRVWICRGSRFHASAVNFLPAACPSNRSTDCGELPANAPMVVTPILASRASVAGPTPHIGATGSV